MDIESDTKWIWNKNIFISLLGHFQNIWILEGWINWCMSSSFGKDQVKIKCIDITMWRLETEVSNLFQPHLVSWSVALRNAESVAIWLIPGNTVSAALEFCAPSFPSVFQISLLFWVLCSLWRPAWFCSISEGSPVRSSCQFQCISWQVA